MKTQNKNLAFNKSAVVDLNDNQLMGVNGGTTTLYPSVIVLITELTKDITK